jgi:hypothetical protein
VAKIMEFQILCFMLDSSTLSTCARIALKKAIAWSPCCSEDPQQRTPAG